MRRRSQPRPRPSPRAAVVAVGRLLSSARSSRSPPVARWVRAEVRVVTPQGASSVGLIVVVDDPVVLEADDAANDTPATAQKLRFPIVVSGRIGKAEDVDWYAFEAEKNQRVTFEVWGNRLENKIHDLQTHLDPILSVHDQSGRELAAADNTHFADPMLSFQAPASGTYYLQVRDTTYTGNPAWSYALHAVTGPVNTSVFPLAVNPGTTAQVWRRWDRATSIRGRLICRYLAI